MLNDKFILSGLTKSQAVFAEKILRSYGMPFEVFPDNTISFTDIGANFLLDVFKTAIQASTEVDNQNNNRKGPWGKL